MPIIRKVIKDADELILGKAVKVYFKEKEGTMGYTRNAQASRSAISRCFGKVLWTTTMQKEANINPT